MNEETLKKLHKEICLAIETYEFENDHLTFEKFKSIMSKYIYGVQK